MAATKPTSEKLDTTRTPASDSTPFSRLRFLLEPLPEDGLMGTDAWIEPNRDSYNLAIPTLTARIDVDDVRVQDVIGSLELPNFDWIRGVRVVKS